MENKTGLMKRQKGAQFQNSKENISIVDSVVFCLFGVEKIMTKSPIEHERLERGAMKCDKTTAILSKSMH